MAKLRFSVDSALLSEIGEKLVESVQVALLELVKNSYDADATHVCIKMIPAEVGYSIVVEDDGTGMSFEDVKSFWMRIATTHKIEDDITSKFGRKKTGSKGIGRFACRRLGTKLELETTAKKGKSKFETSSVKIDWSEYVAGSNIDQIVCEGKRRESSSGKPGTRLVISDSVSNEWSNRAWLVLRRRLILLVSNRGQKRRGYERDPGFNATIEAPDFEEGPQVNPRDELMDVGWGRLGLTVDKKGKVVWTLSAKKLGKKSITKPQLHPEFAGTTADIAIFPLLSKEHLRKPNKVSIVELRQVFDGWGGIHIRKDGIRVPPYGEGRNDWLYIDRDRGIRKVSSDFDPVSALAESLKGVNPSRVLLGLLSNKSYVGDVHVGSPKNLFVMKASREGFVGDVADDLREIVRFGIDWSTVYRDFYIRREELEEAQDAKKHFEDIYESEVHSRDVIKSAVNYLNTELKNATADLPAETRQLVLSSAAMATEAIVKTDESQQTELQHLRLVASTSSLLLIFSHEVKSLLGMLDTFQLKLDTLGKRLEPEAALELSEMSTSFKSTKKRFFDLLEMTSLFSLNQTQKKPARIALKPRVEQAKNCFQIILDHYKITLETDRIPASLRVGPILEAELYSVLLNVLSNAIKSVIAKGGKKEIAVRAKKVSAGSQINVLDSGVGVSKDSDDLFESFVSDPLGTFYPRLEARLNPADTYIVGTGSGLGLSIVREIIEARDGKIGFASAPSKWKCNLEIVLP